MKLLLLPLLLLMTCAAPAPQPAPEPAADAVPKIGTVKVDECVAYVSGVKSDCEVRTESDGTTHVRNVQP